MILDFNKISEYKQYGCTRINSLNQSAKIRFLNSD